jgi:hypothetical protein
MELALLNVVQCRPFSESASLDEQFAITANILIGQSGNIERL